MGDDDRFEYVYKFVSSGRVVANTAPNAAGNDKLLDDGTLYVARFHADSSGEWLPLRHSADGPLSAAAGFRNQAEVLIQTRAAADLLGATPMDRPEDIEVHPTNGHIFIACTRNEARTSLPAPITYAGRTVDPGTNAPNPRADNRFGHIVEIAEALDDHTATRFRWDVILMGDSADGRTALGSPDNLAFDDAGRLWIVTDGAQPDGSNDGCFVCSTEGANRGVLRRLMSGPIGAEVGGCVFAPGCDTLFLSIQHPGEGGTIAQPTSSWPDGGDQLPRSSVIAIRREDGGVVGG
jgi:secreted PhoX family phosphatase